MANSQAFCTSAKLKALAALVPPGDVLKAALYFATASIGAATSAYSATGEVTGAGYSAGGVTVTHASAASASGTTAIWTPTASFSWPGLTAAAFDALLLYNSSDSNSAIETFTFGSQTIVAGTFLLTMPVNDASNALARIG